MREMGMKQAVLERPEVASQILAGLGDGGEDLRYRILDAPVVGDHAGPSGPAI